MPSLILRSLRRELCSASKRIDGERRSAQIAASKKSLAAIIYLPINSEI